MQKVTVTASKESAANQTHRLAGTVERPEHLFNFEKSVLLTFVPKFLCQIVKSMTKQCSMQ